LDGVIEEEHLIGEYVKKYSTEEWVRKRGFIKKENYYQFTASFRSN
jgi:hypothetical protein